MEGCSNQRAPKEIVGGLGALCEGEGIVWQGPDVGHRQQGQRRAPQGLPALKVSANCPKFKFTFHRAPGEREPARRTGTGEF